MATTLLLALAGAPPAEADEKNFDLNNFLWKNRLLFVFSPSGTHPDYLELSASMEKNRAEMDDRDMVLFEVFESGPVRVNGKGAPTAMGEDLRRRYHIQTEALTVLLIGKDGTEKMRIRGDVDLDAIFILIDGMPMRRQEIRMKSKVTP